MTERKKNILRLPLPEFDPESDLETALVGYADHLEDVAKALRIIVLTCRESRASALFSEREVIVTFSDDEAELFLGKFKDYDCVEFVDYDSYNGV